LRKHIRPKGRINTMKINTSYVIAGALLFVGAIWFIVNSSGGEDAPVGTTLAETQQDNATAIPTVQIRTLIAQEHPDVLELYGQTRANREVSVKAETAGAVVALGVSEGKRVARGDILCRQDVDARQAVVNQAKANLRSVESDLNAARVLADKGYQSQTRVIQFEAQLDGARATLEQAEIEADNVNIRAPFAGIWTRRDAQIGDYLSPGQSCGHLVDLSPLKLDVQLTQQQLGNIARDDAAEIILATGQTVQGKVTYVDAIADPGTRTFRTEIILPNEDGRLRAGVTGTVRLEAGRVDAHQLPSRVLTLNDEGDIGVRYVDNEDRVRFASVRTVDETPEGIWVTGLPERVRLIVEGQDFVDIGMIVDPNEGYGTNLQAQPLTGIASSSAQTQ
jgi:multidrug efflux system membrane fusion protein